MNKRMLNKETGFLHAYVLRKKQRQNNERLLGTWDINS